MERHSASDRNKRKAAHHASNLLEELKRFRGELTMLGERVDRAIKLACKVEDRTRTQERKKA